MALSAGNIIDVQTGGSDSNAGFFNPTNANFATDLTTDTNTANTTAPVCSSASYNFAARDVGHWLFVKSGTGWTPGWYQIASVASNKATLTATIGSADLYNSAAATTLGLNTAAGCATVGTPTGGTWSIDYSRSTGAGVAFTDLVIDGTTNTDFTSAANPGGKNFVGNGVNVTSGTGFTVQRVEIVSIPSGVIMRADKSMGTLSSTGGNGNLGGSLATPGQGFAFALGSNTVYLKSGNYTCSNSSNVAGGRITISVSGGDIPTRLVGYQNYRADNSTTRPTLKATANSVNLVTTSGLAILVANIAATINAAETSVVGFSLGGTHVRCENCTATSVATGFTVTSATATVENAEAITCTSNGFSVSAASCIARCYARGGTGSANGFSLVGVGGQTVNCISAGNAGSGFSIGQGGCRLINCTAYNNTSNGFVTSTTPIGTTLANCVAWGNGSDFADGSADAIQRLHICAGSASTFPTECHVGFITLTAAPFIDAAGGDFRLNSTAGGGALLKGLGYPQTYPGLSGVANYPDVGAYQSASVVVSDGAIFAPQGSLGSGTNKATQTTVSTTTGVQIGVGQLAIFVVGSDNEDSADGATALHTSVTVAGHGATKLGEYTNAQGAANAGATVSLWYLVNTTGSTIAAASAIVATATVGKDAKVVQAHLFDWDQTYTVVADGLTTVADDAADPSSITATGTLDVPHLWVRAIAYETSNVAAGVLTPTAGWTSITGTGTTGGADSTNISVRFEYKVSSGTSSGASNPTGVAVDSASVLAGLAATLAGATGARARLLIGI